MEDTTSHRLLPENIPSRFLRWIAELLYLTLAVSSSFSSPKPAMYGSMSKPRRMLLGLIFP